MSYYKASLQPTAFSYGTGLFETQSSVTTEYSTTTFAVSLGDYNA